MSFFRVCIHVINVGLSTYVEVGSTYAPPLFHASWKECTKHHIYIDYLLYLYI